MRMTFRNIVIAVFAVALALSSLGPTIQASAQVGSTSTNPSVVAFVDGHDTPLWGFNVAGTQPCETPPLPKSAKGALMRLWDNDVTWGNIEPKPNEFHWGHLDDHVECLTGIGARPILTLGMTPAWASRNPEVTYTGGAPYKPTNFDYWKRYVNRVAQRYKGRIKIYEIWNETEGTKYYWRDSPEDMAILQEIAYREIKRVDPDAIVLSPAFGRTGVKFCDRWLAAGGGKFMDGLAIHPYGRDYDPSTIGDIADEFRVLLKKYGIETGLWATETSWLITNPEGTKTYLKDPAKISWLVDKSIKELNAQDFVAVIWYALKVKFVISFTNAPKRFAELL